MPDTAKDQAVRTLDRLRSIVSEVDWTAISGNFNLTMSVGICSIRQANSAEDILARADIARYRAKDAGRNRVVAAYRDLPDAHGALGISVDRLPLCVKNRKSSNASKFLPLCSLPYSGH